ncbi:MAG: B12-binding domain-containing radical SAM protein [Clostridiales bacterium]|nr:B12-binding domain-containing radical SAM protein [Clostridiales bacterium]
MKLLLVAINAKYIHSNPAVYSLRAYAGEYGEQISLAEYTINQSIDVMLKGIFRRKPEVLCISCYIWNISIARELAEEVHRVLPDTKIWLGGPEVSYDAKQVLERNPQITGVMMGEGEETFLELVRHYADGAPGISEIRGIAWRGGDGLIRDNGFRGPVDLDTVPFIYQDLSGFENRILYYESSRGCPFSCSYCLSSIDRKLRFRSMELVKRELQFFLDHKVPQVKFVDRTFNCSHQRALEIWRYLTEHDNGVTNFHFEIAADLLNEEELELIASMRPGMIQLEIGVQSTNPEVVREIRRKMDFDRVARVVRRLSENHNVHLHLDLIAGLPLEDFASFGRSFDQVYALRPQQLQLGFLKVLKGAYMYEKAADYGCVYRQKEPYEVLFTRWISFEEILRLKQTEEMVEVYYNSGQFARTVEEAEKYFSSPFAFYDSLGAFCDRMGYLEISHTRVRRYEILEGFLENALKERQDREDILETVREKMVLDLYSRENLKSRPQWAGSLEDCRGRIREFYRREAQTHRYLPEYEDYDEKQLMRMTHLERTGASGGERFWLFDYRKRDPITREAACTDVTEAVREL